MSDVYNSHFIVLPGYTVYRLLLNIINISTIIQSLSCKGTVIVKRTLIAYFIMLLHKQLASQDHL